MAGKGCKTGRQIDNIMDLVDRFPDLRKEDWQKVKVQYDVYDGDEIRQIEVHSYQNKDFKHIDEKLKLRDGRAYVDEWE